MSADKTIYRLAAMGDVMLDREVGHHFRERPKDFEFKDLRAILAGHELVFLNLEAPVGVNGTPHHIQDPHVTFCSHPDTLQVLKNLGTTVVSLGNNHMLDYGPTALHETLECLDSAGIKHAGAGRNYEEANRPLLFECNNKKIALLSYVFIYSASTLMAKGNSPGVSDYRIKNILPVIRGLRERGYQVIVSIHWGQEYSFYPLPYQKNQARRMIDNGASLILGHGPHYPQGIEKYREGTIIYSLGNFIFDEPYKFANRSFIFSTGVTEQNKLQGIKVYPVHIVQHIPTLVAGGDKKRIENLVRGLSLVYPRKNRTFWKKINNDYFRDIVHRVLCMKSLKFLFLPPLSFYFDIGFINFLKKLKFANLLSVFRSLFMHLLTSLKKYLRLLLPMNLRMKTAVWLDKQTWIPRSEYWAKGLVHDLMETEPKTFHKFIWEKHLRSYTQWYDSESLFKSYKMNGSTATCGEFFHDLVTVLKDAQTNQSAEINSILEVGCSLGYLLRNIEENIFPGATDLVGIDIDKEAIKKGKDYLAKIGSQVRLLAGDMEDLDRLVGEQKFNFVFASGVLSYVNEEDAFTLVSQMLRRTTKIMALLGLADRSTDNSKLTESIISQAHNNQWIHNFDAMVEKAGGRVIKRRWQIGLENDTRHIYYIFAVPAESR